MPVDEIGWAAEALAKGVQLAAISDTSASCRKRCSNAWPSVAASGRKAPARSGRKPLVTGRNGAVSVRWSPIATRGAAALSVSSEIASERCRLGATTITEVALMRPRTTRSRMAVLTEVEMP